MIKELPEINPLEFKNLYEMLNKKKLPFTGNNNNSKRGRYKFPDHRSATLGLVKQRLGGLVALSKFSIDNPEIFDEIVRIGDEFCPFLYTSIHLNHCVTCPKHKDGYNNGDSMLVSFGEYSGSKIVIEYDDKIEVFNTKHKPILFNGAKYFHWNTPDLEGNKYSLVFYNSKKCY